LPRARHTAKPRGRHSARSLLNHKATKRRGLARGKIRSDPCAVDWREAKVARFHGALVVAGPKSTPQSPIWRSRSVRPLPEPLFCHPHDSRGAALPWGPEDRPGPLGRSTRRRRLALGARPFATASRIAGSGVARDGGPTLTGALARARQIRPGPPPSRP
jgi:hypothetical protein